MRDLRHGPYSWQVYFIRNGPANSPSSRMFDPGHFGMASLDHDGLYYRRSQQDGGEYRADWRGKAARLGPTRTSCAELQALHRC
jgi:hypothetical protein